MADAGARVVKHVNDLAFMGFIEVIANIFENPIQLRTMQKAKWQRLSQMLLF